MQVIYTLQLPFKVSGQEIINAVKQIAGDSYVQTYDRVIDDTIWFKVGARSNYPGEGLAIAVSPAYTDCGINPSSLYSHIAVVNCEWGGSYYAVLENEKSIIKNARNFRDEIHRLLLK